MFKSASSKRFASILGSLLLFIASAAVYVSGIKPKYQEVQKLRADKEAREVLLDQQAKIVKEFKALLEQYKLPERLQKFSLALPTREEEPQIIVQMENLAKANNLVFRNITIQNAAAQLIVQKQALQKSVSALDIGVQVAGSYGDFKTFLEGIETNLRLMDLRSLNFSASQAKSGGGEFNYDLKIQTYYQED